MSNPIEHNEHEAINRRLDSIEDRVGSLQVQTGGNFAALIEGQTALRREVRDGFKAVDSRFDTLEEKFGSLEEKVDTNQARIIELLTELVGRKP